jgi:uncharacterized membrane protein
MNLFTILLTIHIIGGGLSLLFGLYILLTKKGDKIHKLIGTIYHFSMLASSLIAIPMTYLHPNLFLSMVSIFTIYMLVTGKRYLKITGIEKVTKLDWVYTAIMFLCGCAFFMIGIYLLVKGNQFGIVLVVFGLISIGLCKTDYENFTDQSKFSNVYLTTHIQRMVGSYIASVTAFIVVNNTYLPDILGWLLPTLMITPLIFKWTKKYGKLKK